MKRLKIILLLLIGMSLVYGCSNNSSTDKNSSNQDKDTVAKETVVNEPVVEVQRPEKSDANAKSALSSYDSKVAQVMRSVRELKTSVKDGGKVTPTIEKNITDMIQDAKKAEEKLTPLLDKLSQDDFALYGRDKDRLREKETDFEQLKQNK